MRLNEDFVSRLEAAVDSPDLGKGVLMSALMQTFCVPRGTWRGWAKTGAIHAGKPASANSLQARFFRCEQRLLSRCFESGVEYCTAAAAAEGPSGTRAKLQFGQTLMKHGDPAGYGTQHHLIEEVDSDAGDAARIPEHAIDALTEAQITRLGELADAREAIEEETRGIIEAAIAASQTAG